MSFKWTPQVMFASKHPISITSLVTVFTTKSETRIYNLTNQLLSLQIQHETFLQDLVELNTFIHDRTTTEGKPTNDHHTPPNPHEVESCRIASTYINAILNSLRNRLTALSKDLCVANAGVEGLKKKFLRKLSWRHRYYDEDCGDEWGYFDEWIEEVRELHEMVCENLHGTSV